MRWMIALVLLSGCATTGPRVTFPDNSEDADAWFCFPENGGVTCVDHAELMARIRARKENTL